MARIITVKPHIRRNGTVVNAYTRTMLKPRYSKSSKGQRPLGSATKPPQQQSWGF